VAIPGLKSMNKDITYGALALLLLAPLVGASQDDEMVVDDPVVDPMEQSVPVAAEDPLPDFQPVEVPEDNLLREFARYRQLVRDGALDEADVAAKRIVEMAIKIYGPQSRETANALNNLGIVQHSSGQFDAAIQNFTTAIEIIEIVEDRLNEALINPLKGLGAAQLGNDRPDQARQTFTRAAHITHVNNGPHNVGQIEILESIAEALIRMGETKSARNILDRIHIINVKFFETDPLGLLPSLLNRADWQHRAGYYNEERATYRRAIRIIESSSNKNNPLLIQPLRRLGETFYFIGSTQGETRHQSMVTTGEIYLKRAARIADKTGGNGWHEQAETKLALADYYNYVESQGRSRKIYKEVWDFLSEDDERLAQRIEWFQDPVPVRTDLLPTNVGGTPTSASLRGDVVSGKIIVDYSVTSRGRVRNLRTEAFPEEFTDMQKMVHREIRRRIHRPRIEDGVPVDSDNLVFEHHFSYRQSYLDVLRRANEAVGEEPKNE